MEYHLDVHEKTINPDVQSRSDGCTEVKIGDDTYALEFQRISDRKISLSINGRQVNAWVEKTDQGKTVILNGQYYFILDKDAQTGGKSKKSGAAAPTTVTPPMPAIVIQVPVSQGDVVEKGDTVVVVSAMKMETSLKAPYGGKVTRISVGEGDKVMPGDILVDIEKIKDEETA